VLEGSLQLVEGDRHALDDAGDIRELQLDEPDVVFLGLVDLLHRVLRFDIEHHCRSRLLSAGPGPS
jgi:hypothetical protein